MKTLIALLLASIIPTLFPAQVAPGRSPLLRQYHEGEKLAYHMKTVNEQWRYEIQADGIVKKGPDGTYFEEYHWSHFISDGQALTLPPASQNLVQRVTLDPNHNPEVPDLSHVDPRMIGPVTDMLNFYVDLWLAVKTGNLTHAGDHFYLPHGTPASWADGSYTLIGEDSLDFDFTLQDVNPSQGTATLIARHVPAKKIEIKYPAEWMRTPVADTPNNWVQVQKMAGGKYLAASGKETIEVGIVVSRSDGKVLSVNMDNPVQTVERECADAALTQCGDPKPHFIHRQVEMTLENR